MNMNVNAYYRVTDGPVLDAIKHHLSQLETLIEAAKNFAEKYGASKFFISDIPGLHVSGLLFDGPVPNGWTKPRRSGLSRPKLGTKAHREIESLITLPSETDIIQETTGIPLLLTYEKQDISGSTMLGNPAGPCSFLYRANHNLYGFIAPDISHYVKEYTGVGYTITNGADKWSMKTPGVHQISKQEWDALVNDAKRQEGAELSEDTAN
tara:strand:- start:2801 stop:3427 length:627 start_codon:yes stop_codon:yes gene_type:complete